jgi:co-chaperonin GroES (HSP10)
MIKPTRNNVLVERLENKKETASGIILKSSDEPEFGLVLAVGPEVEQVSIEDKVLVNWNQATPFDDKYIIAEDNIIAVIE